MLLKYNQKIILFAFFALFLSSCSRLGYGVLLWSIDDPPIDSGTVLPVYIRSNIERIWVVGVPETTGLGRDYKLEIPLTQLEFVGSRRNAIQWAQDFAPFAMSYAENLQDGLPIRDGPDNNSRRVYRLRLGEVIKILGRVKGNPPIGASGDPLPGDWYRVMTSDGVIGFCFSYRLRIFNQTQRSIQSSPSSYHDEDLDILLSRKWSAESYLHMITSRRINIQEMEKNYRFDPGNETGIARVILPDIERQFIYDRISSNGERSWQFDGTDLNMTLRGNNTLAVEFADRSGINREFIFAALTTDVDDIIIQEKARRENQYMTIYNQGPLFTSNHYGSITFLRTGGFTWSGYDLLTPQFIPAATRGAGSINMDLYIAPSLENRYNGAFTMQFTDVRSNNTLHFLYGLDNQGLRLEVVPDYGIEDITVMRRGSSPLVLYFFRDSPI
jgi:hypothetical protein